MTVVQTDFVPIVPYVTDNIGIAIGQRYSVIIEANQANATYWLRTLPQKECSAPNANDGKGIASAYIIYEPAPDVLPTSTSISRPDSCDDEFEQIEPYVPVDINRNDFENTVTKESMDITRVDFTRTGTNYTINRCAHPSSRI